MAYNNNIKGDATMRERITFQTNVPVTVALAYADGMQVEGRFGDQIMYTLADERVMARLDRLAKKQR